VNLRLYSVYGPLEDTSRLLPNLLRQALAGKLPPLVDPRTSRDFIHVDDVCAAFIMAAAKMHPGLYGENFNIGTGIKTTIAELADVTRCLFNVAEEPQFGTMVGRAWDLAEWYSDPRKAIEEIGWKPLVKLEDGLRSMALWVAQLTDAELIASPVVHRAESLLFEQLQIRVDSIRHAKKPVKIYLDWLCCTVICQLSSDYVIIYRKSDNTDCGAWFAWASIAVAACWMI
jgi:hypothetical protein